MRPSAILAARNLSRYLSLPLRHTVLRRSCVGDWKKKAYKLIKEAEIVIVYDRERCLQSENAKWEIECATNLSKPIFDLRENGIEHAGRQRIKSIYNFDEEFEKCFELASGSESNLLEQYKIMVQSSEDLVQRRQLTNGFFTTLLSGLVVASGFLFKEVLLVSGQYVFFLFPIFIGLILCRSWSRLLENYGKLNGGKYRVIQRLEQDVGAQVFAAEWYALGNDKRPEKYRSFTKSEGSVPALFGVALVVLGLGALLANDWDKTVDLVLQYFV